MKKKKVKAPVYEQLADTSYISGLRQDLPTYQNYYNQALANLNIADPAVQAQMQKVAEDYTDAQWNDLNRKYRQEYNALNQANYNRFGSLGSTGALYNNETLQRDYNDMASRVASNTASQYSNLMNQWYNQLYNNAQAYGNAYAGAGGTLQNNDIANWNIRNQNINAKYVADVQNAQRNGGWGDALVGGVTGAIGGFLTGGPAGAALGGLGGALSGGFGGSTNNVQSGGAIGNLYQQNHGNNLGNIFTGNTTTGTNGFSLNTKYNPSTWKFSWQQ